LDGREFVIDVQELGSDRFDVVVGNQAYQVVLSGDEDVAEAVITPGMQATAAGPGAAVGTSAAPPGPARAPVVARAAPPPPAAKPAGGGAKGGSGSLNAPMPGVILELHVKVGDVVQRGQQVAVLDAMKMHNFIGAPRAGTIAEVCVAAGQAVGHGDPIVRFAEG
jgi:biotin carboxyl carrier protein